MGFLYLVGLTCVRVEPQVDVEAPWEIRLCFGSLVFCFVLCFFFFVVGLFVWVWFVLFLGF